MADDSIKITEPFDFHPCNSPRGMLYYDLNVLTPEQQRALNNFKRDVVREDEKYLAKHPEVRAVIALVTRQVLKYRPRSDLPQFIGNFFSRPKPDIQDEIYNYIAQREPHIYEGDSAVLIHDESTIGEGSELLTSTNEEELEQDLANVPKTMLDEILNKAYKRLGIDVNDTGVWEPRPESEDDAESVVKSVISEILSRSAKEVGQTDLERYLRKLEMEEMEAEMGRLTTPQLAELYVGGRDITHAASEMVKVYSYGSSVGTQEPAAAPDIQQTEEIITRLQSLTEEAEQAIKELQITNANMEESINSPQTE